MITLALPKGSLEAQTLQLFKEADLEVRRTDRDYNPRIDDPRIGKIKILRPQEIPTYVDKGYFDLGDLRPRLGPRDRLGRGRGSGPHVQQDRGGEREDRDRRPPRRAYRKCRTDPARQPGDDRIPRAHKEIFCRPQNPRPALPLVWRIGGKGARPHGRGRGPDRDGNDAAEKRPQDHRPDHGVAHGHHREQGELGGPRKAAATQPAQPAGPPQIGSEPIVKLTRAATSNGQQPSSFRSRCFLAAA